MKSPAKIGFFIVTLGATIGLLQIIAAGVFGKDPGFLRHSGAGHVTFYVLFVLNVFLFQKYVNRASFYSLGLEMYPGWPVTVLKGWAAGCIAFLGYTLLMDTFDIIDLHYKYGMERIILGALLAFTGFTIAAAEEILFRGFFLQTLLKDLPAWAAVILTGIIFVLFHKLGAMGDFFTEPYDRMLAGGIFSLNLLLCFAYLKSKTLYLPIGIHAGLVSTKVFFRKLKLMDVDVTDSYWFGLDGDARRGYLAWILFIAGIFVLRYLITDREKKALANKPVPNPS